VADAFVQDSVTGLGTATGLSLSDVSPAAPFAAVEVDVTGAGAGVVLAGLGSAAGDHVVAVFDARRQRVGIEVRRAGRTRLVRRRKVGLPAAFRLGFAVCENQVTVLADTGAGWSPLLTERRRVAALLDLRQPETLRALTYLWGARPGSGEVVLGDVRAGLFGMTGLRDPHLVQHADGRPYLRDGKAFLTFTCAGLGGFAQAHWGVFCLDLEDPTRVEQVAQLYTHRHGLILGDHAGQLIRDGDRWIVLTSSWGDFVPGQIHVRHTTSAADLLRGVHLLETEKTPLPTELCSWDPGLSRVDGRWHLSFVESPSQQPFEFHPALAAAPNGGDWRAGLSMVGAAKDLRKCEGPILTRVRDAWWLVASDAERRCYPVFTMAMERVGVLDAPYPTNIPHPQIVPLPDGGHLLVTFNGAPFAKQTMGYGGHGDVIVMRTRLVGTRSGHDLMRS
jgi:hypothetical protein